MPCRSQEQAGPVAVPRDPPPATRPQYPPVLRSTGPRRSAQQGEVYVKWTVRRGSGRSACRAPAAQALGALGIQDQVQHGSHDRDDQRTEEGRPKAVDGQLRAHPRRDRKQARIDDQREQTERQDRQRESQQVQNRPQDRVHEAEQDCQPQVGEHTVVRHRDVRDERDGRPDGDGDDDPVQQQSGKHPSSVPYPGSNAGIHADPSSRSGPGCR